MQKDNPMDDKSNKDKPWYKAWRNTLLTKLIQFVNKTTTKVFYHGWKKFIDLRPAGRALLYALTIVICGFTVWGVITTTVQDDLTTPLYITTLLHITTPMYVTPPIYVMTPLYVIAALSLTASVFHLVRDIHYIKEHVVKPIIDKNRYTNKMVSDYRFRTFIFTVPGLTGNIIFAAVNAMNGIAGHSAWFMSLAAYYLLLSLMRIGVVQQERRIRKIDDPEVKKHKEMSVFFRNSILLIGLAWVLAGLIIVLECSKGGKEYPGFTIYVMAAYVFYRFVLSCINIVKVKKEKSPLLTMIRRIGTIDASVSVLTLQTAMFTAFSEGNVRFEKLSNGIVGTVICLMVIGFGVHGIYVSKKEQGK